MSNSAKTGGTKDKANSTWTSENEATLVRALKKAKEDGNWGDNNPRKVAWTSCVRVLSGSEEKSGGIAKDVDVIKRRWQRVCTHHILYHLHHICVYNDFFSSNKNMIYSRICAHNLGGDGTMTTMSQRSRTKYGRHT